MVLADCEAKSKAGDPPARSPRNQPAPQARQDPPHGQFLAFICCNTKIHRLPPAESDLARYFQITPPAVHEMILTLARIGFLLRVPATPRSITLLLPRNQLPDLE